jgi:hypothetical protein
MRSHSASWSEIIDSSASQNVLRQQNLDFLGDGLMMPRDFSSGVFSTGSSVAISVSGDRFDELVRARPAPR